MTDKPRLIDADKLIKWFVHSPDSDGFLEGSSCVNSFNSLTDAISSGLFNPDPPQQPQVGKRNWQEDMNLCMKVDEAWSRELFIADQPDITTYWLQQYAALEREYERFQKDAMGWNDDLTKAEYLIQQKDAEINRLKSQLEEKSRSIKVEDL